jgi:GTP pyrophosphokinase
MLKKELGKRGLVALLRSEPTQAVVEQLNEDSEEDLLIVEDLLAALGYGDWSVDIVERLRKVVKARQPSKED